MDSVTLMLLQLTLLSFKTVMHNSAVSFSKKCARSCKAKEVLDKGAGHSLSAHCIVG